MLIKIGEFSKITMISIRMLRHYNEIGLLVPEHIDDFTGYRYYSDVQITKAIKIIDLKNMGIPLKEIKGILENNNNEKLIKQLSVFYNKKLKEKDLIEAQLNLIENTIKNVQQRSFTMKCELTEKRLPKMQVASVRQIIKDFSKEGQLWKIMMKEIMPQNPKFMSPLFEMAIFHDAEYKETDTDVEILEVVKGNYKDTENVKFKIFPAMDIVSVCFTGAYYPGYATAGQELFKYISDKKYNIIGPAFSIYHKGPDQTDNPDEYETEFCCQIEK